MKRLMFVLPVLVLLVLGSCTLPMRTTETPTAMPLVTEAPAGGDVAPVDTAAPVVSEVAPVETAAQPAAAATAVPTEAPPAAAAPTTAPPATQAAQPTATQPSATQAAQAASTQPAGATFDPNVAYGEPTYENPMDFPNMWEWAPPETNTLPNNSRIRLQFKDGELYVTGQRPEFSTWWFSSHFLHDAYQQLTINNQDCSGDDAYGMILRGPAHLSGPAYGYVVAFTCDGSITVFRLDDPSPFDIEVLENDDDIAAINTGPGAQNVLGVRAEGDKFVVYANGIQVAEFEDDHFSKGRFGVFVRSASGAYTFRVTNLAYWVLNEE
jgi:hypothetical protein